MPSPISVATFILMATTHTWGEAAAFEDGLHETLDNSHVHGASADTSLTDAAADAHTIMTESVVDNTHETIWVDHRHVTTLEPALGV